MASMPWSMGIGPEINQYSPAWSQGIIFQTVLSMGKHRSFAVVGACALRVI